MFATLFVLLAMQSSAVPAHSFLSGFKELGGSKDYWSWPGHPSCYVRDFMAHRDPAKVAAEAKKQLDPQLWEQGPTFGWHNVDGSMAEPTSNWAGRPGSIVEGWTVDITWNWGPLGGDRLGPNKGWSYVSIHSQCKKGDVPLMRELFRYLFGRE